MKKSVYAVLLLVLPLITQAANTIPLQAVVGLTNGDISISADVTGLWDTIVSFNLQPGSRKTSISSYGEPEDGTLVTPMHGAVSLFFKNQYADNPQVGINLRMAYLDGASLPLSNAFQLADASGNSMVMTLNNYQGTTTLLSEYLPDYEFADFCSSYPSESSCVNFNYGNSSIYPFVPFATPESGVSNILNLGPVAFVEAGGITTTMLDLEKFINNSPMSLTLSHSSNYLSEEYHFNPVVVPLPAGVWMFISAIVMLMCYRKSIIVSGTEFSY